MVLLFGIAQCYSEAEVLGKTDKKEDAVKLGY